MDVRYTAQRTDRHASIVSGSMHQMCGGNVESVTIEHFLHDNQSLVLISLYHKTER